MSKNKIAFHPMDYFFWHPYYVGVLICFYKVIYNILIIQTFFYFFLFSFFRSSF